MKALLKGKGLLLLAAAAAAGFVCLLARCSAPAVGQAPAAPASSSEFTPAHRDLRSAAEDFFNRHGQPVQPIAFTHMVHLSKGMQCTDCHVGVDKGPDARIPGVSFCMTCHQVIATANPEIQKLAAYQKRGEDIPWQRVYDYSPTKHVKFNHAPHIRAGVECATCHGDMRQRTVAVRTVDMTMGFCLNCHEQKKASVDCTTCHF
ncbi:MAG TPA: cytochrome c3 family protein [Terriglobia bacterium]|nr:cytochrome c3 family protein [Terriglobia bacterium]